VEEIYENLIKAATQARESAYAPYSRFKVGAALLARDGRVFTGSNVENLSFGLTNCAERTAVFTAVTLGVRLFKGLAVVTAGTEPVTPCGACRQVLSEFAPDLWVVCATTGGKRKLFYLSELLPHGFDSFSP
jgi:cytidine deaminase